MMKWVTSLSDVLFVKFMQKYCCPLSAFSLQAVGFVAVVVDGVVVVDVAAAVDAVAGIVAVDAVVFVVEAVTAVVVVVATVAAAVAAAVVAAVVGAVAVVVAGVDSSLLRRHQNLVLISSISCQSISLDERPSYKRPSPASCR
jgi:hypothetical protein